MFKAITKDKAPNCNTKGTLSALWQKKTQSKLNEGEGGAQPANGPGAAPADAPTLESAGQAAGGCDLTPDPSGRQDQRPQQEAREEAMAQQAPDVNPAAAAAAAAAPGAMDQQEPDATPAPATAGESEEVMFVEEKQAQPQKLAQQQVWDSGLLAGPRL
jgi:hypothetical protein